MTAQVALVRSLVGHKVTFHYNNDQRWALIEAVEECKNGNVVARSVDLDTEGLNTTKPYYRSFSVDKMIGVRETSIIGS